MSPKKPETPVRIDSEVTFREKVGLSWSPVSLEWKKDQVLETTEGALTKLRDELSGKASADEKKAVAEAFLRSQEQAEAEGDLGDQLTATLWDGLKDKLIKSGVVVGAVAAGTALIQWVDSQLSESTGMKLNLWGKLQAWAAKEYKTTNNAFMKWILEFFIKDKDKAGAESGVKPGNTETQKPTDTRIDLTIAGLKKFSPVVSREKELYKDPKHFISHVFTYDQLLSRKYSDLKSIHDKYSSKNPNGIEKDLDIKPIDGMSPLTMYLAIHLIMADERFFEMFQSKKPGTNWKEESFGNVLKVISSDIGSIERLALIKDPTELQKIFDDWLDLLSLEDGVEKWDLANKLSTLRENVAWYKEKVTGRVVKAIFIRWGNITDEIMSKEWFTEKEQTFIKELRLFGSKLPNTLMADPRVDLGAGISRGFQNKPLELKEVFTLFLMTDWITEFDHLWWFAKFNVYRVLNKSLADHGRVSTIAWDYKATLVQEFIKASAGMSTKLPEDVQVAFDTITWGMKNMILEYIKSIGGQLAGAMKDPKIAAIVVAWVVWVMYIGRVAILSKAVLAWVIGTILTITAIWTVAGTKSTLEWAQKSLEK